MGKYVFSTVTSTMRYRLGERRNGISIPTAVVEIAGGANVANKHFVTPKGVMTQVTDEEYAILEECPAFVRHRDAGYIRVEDAPHPADEVARDMSPKDGSAPLTAEDYEADGAKAPTTANMAEAEGATPFQRSARPGQAATQIPVTESSTSEEDNDSAQSDTTSRRQRKRKRTAAKS